MLEERELPELLDLLRQASSGADSAFAVVQDFHTSSKYDALKERYRDVTGSEMTMACFSPFHRLADYGPPCGRCGVPLRTQKATFCAACGHRRAAEQSVEADEGS